MRTLSREKRGSILCFSGSLGSVEEAKLEKQQTVLYMSVSSIGWWQPGLGGVLVTRRPSKAGRLESEGKGKGGGEASQPRGVTGELPEEDGDLQGMCRGLNILDVGNLGLRVEGHL